ncbi:MAG: thioesterase [Chloroflexi bacterium]|nr:thioesterase [Chloroflexota bacterium]
MAKPLDPGMSVEETIETRPGMGVKHVGPVEMLSTPSMIGMMEGVCLKVLQQSLEGSITSVGYHVDVKHLAPHPVGKPVRVKSTFVNSDGRRYTFQVQAYSGEVKIGEGTHTRVAVDPSKFRQRPPGS